MGLLLLLCAASRTSHRGHLCAGLHADSSIPPHMPSCPTPRPLLCSLEDPGQSPAEDNLGSPGTGWSEGSATTSGDLIASWHYDITSPAFPVPAWISPSSPVGTLPWGL